ncbi:MAG: heavy-metal-associated domain-containing protein [Clostridia bacterium]|jgi:copper chaperone CopZ|nr:heavy-metal-associated domain-containing protein [Clostridia bacterium]
MLRIRTEGMGCPHCIKKVTKAVEGAGAELKSMELNDFTLEYSGDPDDIKKAVEAAGFKVVSVEEA